MSYCQKHGSVYGIYCLKCEEEHTQRIAAKREVRKKLEQDTEQIVIQCIGVPRWKVKQRVNAIKNIQAFLDRYLATLMHSERIASYKIYECSWADTYRLKVKIVYQQYSLQIFEMSEENIFTIEKEFQLFPFVRKYRPVHRLKRRLFQVKRNIRFNQLGAKTMRGIEIINIPPFSHFNLL